MRLYLPAFVFIAIAGGCMGNSDVSREVGARCQVHDQCDDVCLQGASWPDGFCTVHCTADRECMDDSVCVDVEQGVCLFRCAEPADCEFLGPGWSCNELAARSDGALIAVCTGPLSQGLP